jgi:hypothetical protein
LGATNARDQLGGSNVLRGDNAIWKKSEGTKAAALTPQTVMQQRLSCALDDGAEG